LLKKKVTIDGAVINLSARSKFVIGAILGFGFNPTALILNVRYRVKGNANAPSNTLSFLQLKWNRLRYATHSITNTTPASFDRRDRNKNNVARNKLLYDWDFMTVHSAKAPKRKKSPSCKDGIA